MFWFAGYLHSRVRVLGRTAGAPYTRKHTSSANTAAAAAVRCENEGLHFIGLPGLSGSKQDSNATAGVAVSRSVGTLFSPGHRMAVGAVALLNGADYSEYERIDEHMSQEREIRDHC